MSLPQIVEDFVLIHVPEIFPRLVLLPQKYLSFNQTAVAVDSRNRSAQAVTSIQEQSFAFAYGYIRALLQEAQKS